MLELHKFFNKLIEVETEKEVYEGILKNSDNKFIYLMVKNRVNRSVYMPIKKNDIKNIRGL